MRFAYLLVLFLASRLAPAEMQWARHTRGSLPERAVVLDGGGLVVTVLCRARLADGNLHPGTFAGGSCAIPQKGRVEHAAEFEIAVNGTPRWSARDWGGATVVGRQGRGDLYFCRAAVRVGATNAGWAFGKAYREGPHARHCYVAFQKREIDAGRDFDLLQIGP